MKFRFTIEELNIKSDVDMLKALLVERMNGLNPYGPLYKRLARLHKKLENRETLITHEAVGDVGYIGYFLNPPRPRWKQINDETWQSVEDPKITVCVNLESVNDEDREDKRDVYFVFPANDETGIPNSPYLFYIDDYDDAKAEATKTAQKIMELSIEKIKHFNWDMIK
jgi:hypothetical protein